MRALGGAARPAHSTQSPQGRPRSSESADLDPDLGTFNSCRTNFVEKADCFGERTRRSVLNALVRIRIAPARHRERIIHSTFMAHSDVILAFVRSPIPQTPVTGGFKYQCHQGSWRECAYCAGDRSERRRANCDLDTAPSMASRGEPSSRTAELARQSPMASGSMSGMRKRVKTLPPRCLTPRGRSPAGTAWWRRLMGDRARAGRRLVQV
jgi:hypothetical protein